MSDKHLDAGLPAPLPEAHAKNYGFLIDQGACIGCHACSTACKSENEVPLGVYRTWVKTTETGAYPDTQRHFQVTRCNHCDNPPCTRICPTSAMYQRDDGIVEFDGDACIGCKACMQACPYDAIHIDPNLERGEMLLLPNFRLPTLIHTRSANAKWLYELSHKNPVWIHPSDAERIGVVTGDLMEIETEIGTMVDSAWVTEGIKAGIIAISHHLGRWRLQRDEGIGAGMSSLVNLEQEGTEHGLRVLAQGAAWDSPDPDTARIWWQDVGVHQNLTHAVHPDPISGAHCWHQKALRVVKAPAGARHGDVRVDTAKSMAVFHEWMALSRPATTHSPDGTRRPMWLKRPLKPTAEAYLLPPASGETA